MPPATSSRDKRLLSAYLIEWLVEGERSGRWERRTMSDLDDLFRRYVLPAMGDYRLKDLSRDTVRGWLRSLVAPDPADPASRWRYVDAETPRPLSPKTANKALYSLHNALGDPDSGLAVNPAHLPRQLRPKLSGNRSLGEAYPAAKHPTVAEVKAFLDHIRACDRLWGARLIGLWKLAADSGLRRAELAGLFWDDLDPKTSTLSIGRSLQVDRGVLFLKEPKSARGHRVIGLIPTTMAALDLQRQIQESERSRAPRWVKEQFGYEFDFMFRDLVGRALNPNALTDNFVREWEHAGLRSGPSLHSLRHSHASALLQAGVPLSRVATRLGDDLIVVERTYRHVLDRVGNAQQDRDVLDRLYG
jgi:integrase